MTRKGMEHEAAGIDGSPYPLNVMEVSTHSNPLDLSTGSRTDPATNQPDALKASDTQKGPATDVSEASDTVNIHSHIPDTTNLSDMADNGLQDSWSTQRFSRHPHSRNSPEVKYFTEQHFQENLGQRLAASNLPFPPDKKVSISVASSTVLGDSGTDSIPTALSNLDPLRNGEQLGQMSKRPLHVFNSPDSSVLYNSMLGSSLGSSLSVPYLYDSTTRQTSLSPSLSQFGILSSTVSTIVSRKRRQEARENRDKETSGSKASPSATVTSAETSTSCKDDSEELETKKAKLVPEEKKDQAYWERRRKNNEAAKRSRDARRIKEEEIAMRAAYLEQENLKLRAQITVLKNETAKLHCLLYNRRL